jgi:hypothetical protein
MPKVFGKSNTRDLFCDEIMLQGWPIFLILDELDVVQSMPDWSVVLLFA